MSLPDSTLPASVLELIEMSPIERVILHVLRTSMPGLRIQTLIADDQEIPFLLVRPGDSWGQDDGDGRFIDSASISIQAFCYGLEAETDAALLSEAARVALRDGINFVTPFGYITKVQTMNRAHRVTDWATSSGPVQYADLPTGVQRFEATYRVNVRKPRTNPFRTT